ncbi:nucleolar protein,Nop52-domain-containing protein [Syncephalis plumigaleata]|nr:nucleolar protein,Nop52-domain-containing protein [Syncephalis plumigaleata]
MANMSADPNSNETAFAKRLASNDKKERDRAVKSLRKYLTHRQETEEVELLKLWKGIFYCMWMSDKPLIQQQLCDDLADLAKLMSVERVIPWFNAFWTTMCREWAGVDKHRIDKFYLLMRRFVNAAFRVLQQNQWDSSLVNAYTELLVNGPLSPYDDKIPCAIQLHIADIYIDELEKLANAEEMATLPSATLITPFCLLMAHSGNTGVRSRIREHVFLKVIEHTTRNIYTMEDEEDEEKLEPLPYDLLGLSEILFEIGSDANANVNATSRKRIYKLSATLKEAANTVLNAMGDVMDEIMDEAVEDTEEGENEENEEPAMNTMRSSDENSHVAAMDESDSSEHDDDDDDEDEENMTNNEQASIPATITTGIVTRSALARQMNVQTDATGMSTSFRKRVPIAFMPEPIVAGKPGKSVLKRRPNDIVLAPGYETLLSNELSSSPPVQSKRKRSKAKRKPTS